MRADNNWEDKVGKKLFEFEGELSPQNWESIRQQIQPERKPWWRWLWLPALLLLLTIPAAFYFYPEKPENPVSLEEATQPPLTATSKSDPATLATTKPENLGGEPAHRPKAKQEATENQQPAQFETGKEPDQNSKATASADKLAGSKNPAPLGKVSPGIFAVTDPEKPKKKEKINQEKPASEDFRNTGTETRLYAAGQHKKPGKTLAKTTEKPDRADSETSRKANAISETRQADAVIALENNAAEIPASSQPEAGETKQTRNELATGGNKPSNPNSVATETNKALEVAKPDSAAVVAGGLVAPLIQTDSAAAEIKLPNENRKHWSFAIYGSPQYSFQRVKANHSDEIMILRMNNKNQLESERIGYEFGLRSYYNLSGKVKLEGGLHFARLNQHLNFTTTRPGADSLTVSVQNGQLLIEVMNREQNEVQLFKYYFGGLYAGAQFSLNQNWHLNGGMGGNWMIMKTPDEATIPIATKNFTPYLSAGMRYQLPLQPGIALQMGPTVQYYLRSIQKADAFCGTKPTNFGFSVGLLFTGKD